MTHCFSRRTSSKEAQPPQRFFQARSSRLMRLFLKPKTACSPCLCSLPDPVRPGKGQRGRKRPALLVRHPLRCRAHGRKPLDSAAGARLLAHSAGLHQPAPAAYQYTTFPLGTEDCLTLDIYSSAEAKKRPSSSICTAAPPQLISRAARLRTRAGRGLRLCRAQLPAGAVRVELPARPHCRPGRHRKLCPAGHRPGAGLGAGQHPPLWRRCRQHHPLRLL